MACPTCHGELPRSLIELPSVPISIVGVKGSGKTNLLAAGLWTLARHAGRIGLHWTDADPRFNQVLHRNESMLFMSGETVSSVVLPASDVAGTELYRSIRIGGSEELAPRPMCFVVGRLAIESRSVLHLFDNAGEHFMPDWSGGASRESKTRHLKHAKSIIVTFDPLQHRGFRERFAARGAEFGGNALEEDHQRQEILLAELIARLRRLRGLAPAEPVDVPIVIALTKADVWGAKALASWRETRPAPIEPGGEGLTQFAPWLEQVSTEAEAPLQDTAPEFVNAVRSLASRVRFVPVSALGTSPRHEGGLTSLRSSDINPRWAAAPFLAALVDAGLV